MASYKNMDIYISSSTWDLCVEKIGGIGSIAFDSCSTDYSLSFGVLKNHGVLSMNTFYRPGLWIFSISVFFLLVYMVPKINETPSLDFPSSVSSPLPFWIKYVLFFSFLPSVYFFYLLIRGMVFVFNNFIIQYHLS